MPQMKTKSSFVGLLTQLEIFIIISLTFPFGYLARIPGDPDIVFTYNRVSEVETHCRTFLSSASKLELDDDIACRLKSELSFLNGEWKQETGNSPLMPFQGYFPSSSSSFPTPLKLVSFDVKNVSSVQHFRNTVSIGGILLIGISSEIWSQGFNLAPNFLKFGSSGLTFAFEGIYTESEENGGERRLCLMGKSTLTSGMQVDRFLNLAYDSSPLENDRISLVLRYPMIFNLTREEIRGEMRSLDEKMNSKFFDTVSMSSQLDDRTRYHFSATVLASATCDPDLYGDEMLEDGFDKLTASDFCDILHDLARRGLSILSDYKFSGRYVGGVTLEYVLFGKDLEDVGLSYENVKFILQIVRCEPETTNDSSGAAKVSAVVRAIPAGMNPISAQTLTGSSVLSLYAEGMWNSSTGKLCMVGFPRGIEPRSELDTSKIVLYFPRTLSIKQRSIVSGKISSTRNGIGSKVHLYFDEVNSPYYTKNYQRFCHLPYNYSKLSKALALAFRKKDQRFSFFSNLRQYFFTYPVPWNGEEPRKQLDRLFNELLVEGYVDPGQLSKDHDGRIFVQMEVFSLGPYLRSFSNYCPVGTTFRTRDVLLNISTQLVFKEFNQGIREFVPTSYKNFTQLYLEGLYDPTVGQMHLIGCRKVATRGSNTERGLDCLIEVKVQCQSGDMQWLVNPTAKITITSQRNKEDRLHFGSISLHILMTHYKDNWGTVPCRKTFEGLLRIPVLLGIVAVAAGQLKYMKKETHIVSYVCLVMLGLQVLGYGDSLIIGYESLFKSKEPKSYTYWSPYNTPRYGQFLKFLDYARKLLLLVAMLLTASIFQVVSKSWNKPLDHSVTKHICSPHNKRVLLITAAIYTPVLLAWLVVHGHSQSNMEFTSVIQDFFLVPQIVSNILWRRHVKSLTKGYYIGLTLLRFSSNLYEFASDPILGFKQEEELNLGLKDDASIRFAKIVVMMAMLVLAAILHIQQNSKYLSATTFSKSFPKSLSCKKLFFTKFSESKS